MKKILLFVTLLTIVAFPQEHRFKGNVKVNRLEATAVNAQKITADSVLSLHLVGVDTSYAGLDSIQVYNAIALKADKNSPTFTGTVTLPSTTSIGNVSSTELGYLDNVTGSIQSQINAKLNATDTLSLSNRINTKASIAQLGDSITVLKSRIALLESGMSGTLIAPTLLTAVGDTNRFFLTWDDNSSVEDGFYLSASPDGLSWETPFSVPANTTSYTYFLVGNGITRYFRVSAFVGGLETAKVTSEPAITLDLRDLTPPYLPYNVTATGGSGKITVTWSDSSTDAVKYYIYRSPTDVPTGLVALDSTTAKTYVDNISVYSQVYYYRVKGRDANYNFTEYSLSDSGITNPQLIQQPPTNPPIFAVLFENGNLSEFTSTSGTQFSATTASKYSGSYGGEMYFDGITMTSYGIETYTYPDTTYISFKVKISSGITSSATYKYTTLAEFRKSTDYALRFYTQTGGTSHFYTWGAYYKDSTGENSYSSTTNFTTDVWHLIEIKYKKHSSIGGAEIWIDSTLNTTLSKTNRNTSGNTLTNIRFGSTYTSSSPGFSGGSIYFDNIYADTTRLGSGSTDTTTVPAPDTTPPTAPTNFVARGYFENQEGRATVDLSWTDNSGDEQKIRIYRGTKDVIGGNLTLIDSVNANVTTYQDQSIAIRYDTLHTYEYGISVRDAAYNWSAITSLQRDTAYISGVGVTPPAGTPEGNAYFVSLNGNGTTGKSWTNAWNPTAGWDSSATNPNGINWNVIQAGDTIYFDGGVTSMDYSSAGTFSPKKNGTYSNYVYLVKGTSSGHNGTVIISNVSGLTTAHCIEFNGWTVTGYWSHEIVNGYTVNGYHLRFKNIRTVDAGTTLDKFFNFTGHPRYFEFINCWLKQSPAATSQSDLIWIRGNADYSGGGDYADSIFIEGCTLLSENQSASPHSDGFQGYWVKNIWAVGNKFYTANNKSSYTQTFYNELGSGKVYVLNNLFYIMTPAASSPEISLSRNYTQGTITPDVDSCYFYDNTVVSNLPSGRTPYAERALQLKMGNNIFINVASGSSHIQIYTANTATTSDYNIFYSPNMTTKIYRLGTNYTLANWQATGRDINSTHTQPTFTSFDWGFSQNESTYLGYNFNVPSPVSGTAFTVSFGNRIFTSDGKIGALIP